MDEAEKRDIIGAFKIITEKLHAIETKVIGLKDRVDKLELAMDGVLTILELNVPRK